jgi:hypothetical protein
MYRNKKNLLALLSFGLAIGAHGNDYSGLGIRGSAAKISDLQSNFVKKYNSLNHSNELRKKRKRKRKISKLSRRNNR